MRLPRETEILALHKQYAPSSMALDLVWKHSNAVWDIARQLMSSMPAASVDVGLVRVGSLLHDIGVYTLVDENGKVRPGEYYIKHGVAGEAILKQEGLPERIWRFASHHTGVGLQKEDIIEQKLPLPLGNYVAQTDEELLVMYADKFHSKTDPPQFNSFERYKRQITEFGDDKAEKFEAMARKFGKPELIELSKKYGYAIR